MIKIENVEVVGMNHAIRGMRNPMNSHNKMDSGYGCNGELCMDCNGNIAVEPCAKEPDYIIGPNDHNLMMRLAKGGPVHAKYRRMIVVYADITAPIYWWSEYDTYKVGTVANSTSTMHKIHAKEFTLDDFSCEHIKNFYGFKSEGVYGHEVALFENALISMIESLNWSRKLYLQTGDKQYWWQMIQLLPNSYNYTRTIMLNYEVLAGIYPMRKNHKLDCWREFCSWIESLPYSEIITGEAVSTCS